MAGYWQCSQCGSALSDDSHKEMGVNDSYVIIYECKNCKTRGFTVTKNTTDINGGTVIRVLDKEIYNDSEIQAAIKELVGSKQS